MIYIHVYIYSSEIFVYIWILGDIQQRGKICLQQNANQLDDSIRFHDAVHFDDWVQFVANDVVAQQFQNSTSWPDQQV